MKRLLFQMMLVAVTRLTAVGLLPIAVSGLDIEAMMKGAAAAREDFGNQSLVKIQLINMQQFEMFYITKEKPLKCSLTMSQHYNISLNGGNNYLVKVKEKIKKVFSHLLQTSQLILHSLGQYVQEGRRDLFETVIKVDKSTHELTIE